MSSCLGIQPEGAGFESRYILYIYPWFKNGKTEEKDCFEDVCKLTHELLVKILGELSAWLNISEPIFLIHDPHV